MATDEEFLLAFDCLTMENKFWCFTISQNDRYMWIPYYVNWLESTPKMSYFVCQLERAPNTGRLHWQGYCEFKRHQSRAGVKRALRDKTAHVEARKGSRDEAIAYCKKLATRVELEGKTASFEMGTPAWEVKSVGPNSVYSRALASNTYEDALSTILEGAPRDYVLYHKNVLSTLNQHFYKPVETRTNFQFNIPYTEPDVLREKAIIITGPSGIGKTRYALQHFEKPLMVSHIDDLKKLTGRHDGIVFDDMSFRHWPPQSCIHILDVEHGRSINVKYGTITIPAGMKRIFTSNNEFDNIFSENGNENERAAMMRRVYLLTLFDSLF